jgi:hypothetical protein
MIDLRRMADRVSVLILSGESYFVAASVVGHGVGDRLFLCLGWQVAKADCRHLTQRRNPLNERIPNRAEVEHASYPVSG